MLSEKDFSGECFNYYLHIFSTKHAVVLIYHHFIQMRFSSGGILMSRWLCSKKSKKYSDNVLGICSTG